MTEDCDFCRKAEEILPERVEEPSRVDSTTSTGLRPAEELVPLFHSPSGT